MYGTTNYRPTGLSTAFAGVIGSLLVGGFLLTILTAPVHPAAFTQSPVAQRIA